jgi:hypothetical protein
MINVRDEVVRHKTMNNSEEGFLEIASRIEVSPIHNRMLRSEHYMGCVWLHNPDKTGMSRMGQQKFK